jgi:hypothetical protein
LIQVQRCQGARKTNAPPDSKGLVLGALFTAGRWGHEQSQRRVIVALENQNDVIESLAIQWRRWAKLTMIPGHAA